MIILSTMYEYEKFKNISDIASNFYTIKIYSDVNLFGQIFYNYFKVEIVNTINNTKTTPMVEKKFKANFIFSARLSFVTTEPTAV